MTFLLFLRLISSLAKHNNLEKKKIFYWLLCNVNFLQSTMKCWHFGLNLIHAATNYPKSSCPNYRAQLLLLSGNHSLTFYWTRKRRRANGSNWLFRKTSKKKKISSRKQRFLITKLSRRKVFVLVSFARNSFSSIHSKKFRSWCRRSSALESQWQKGIPFQLPFPTKYCC